MTLDGKNPDIVGLCVMDDESSPQPLFPPLRRTNPVEVEEDLFRISFKGCRESSKFENGEP